MDESIDQTQALSQDFTKSGHKNGEKKGDGDEQFYAIATEREKHFDVILRSGTEYTIPYALLPLYVLSGEGAITILAYDLQITIKGRNLKRIRNFLKKETLQWIKESPSGTDIKDDDIFISDIKIEGDSLNQHV